MVPCADAGEDIKSFDIDMEAQTVSVETDMSAEDMLAIVKKAGKVRIQPFLPVHTL